MKQQIIIIHGGTTFPNHDSYMQFLSTLDIDLERLRYKIDWKGTLEKDLASSYEVFTPKMPNATNAKYEEWKLWFENILTRLQKDLILVGHSLGGAFLIRFLSENIIDKKIFALFLVAAPFEPIKDKEYLGSFEHPNKSHPITLPAAKVVILHSKDDMVVPFEQSEQLHAFIEDSQIIPLNNYGHVNTVHFPELVQEIHKVAM